MFSRWRWLPWHSERLRNTTEKYPTITSEQTEAVYLKVFKTIHSAPKMLIQLWQQPKITEPCKFFTYIADGRALFFSCFCFMDHYFGKPNSKDSFLLYEILMSFTRSQSGSNLLCIRKGFMASLVHRQWCHIRGGCHISLGQCSLKFLSASFFVYDFSKCDCNTCILLLHHTLLLPSETIGA